MDHAGNGAAQKGAFRHVAILHRLPQRSDGHALELLRGAAVLLKFQQAPGELGLDTPTGMTGESAGDDAVRILCG